MIALLLWYISQCLLMEVFYYLTKKFQIKKIPTIGKKNVLIQLHVKWGSNKYKNLYFNHIRENDNLKQQNSNTAENITTKSNMV